MDLKTMQADLRRLSALVDGWSQTDEIPAVERDLALEKLRNLYEDLRFPERFPGKSEVPETSSAATSEVESPVSIDLGEVLSLDGFPDLGEPANPIFVEPAALENPGPASTGTPGTETPAPATASMPSAAPEPSEPTPAPTETSGTETPVPASAPTPAADPEPSEPTPAPIPVAESGPSAPESENPPLVEEPASAGEPGWMESPASSRETAPAQDPEPVVTLDPTPAPTPEPASSSGKSHHAASPTLFGLEDEEALRHRHKQRVIMSLYGPSPESETSSEPSVSKPTPESPRHTSQPSGQLDLRTPAEPTPSAHSSNRETPTDPASSEYASDMPATSDTPVRATEESLVSAAVSGTAPRTHTGEPLEHTTPDTPVSAIPTPTSGAVLGEVINHDVQTLADTIAPPHDIASELRRSEPVTDLRKAIGLNDKFLLIRDLFGGDTAAFERAVETLNGFDNLDDCMIFIAEHYVWNPNSDGAKLLMELLERKFA